MILEAAILLVLNLSTCVSEDYNSVQDFELNSSSPSSALKRYCSKTEGEIEILVRPPQQIEVKLGERVSIVCAAHGHRMADPYVYWIKGLGPDFEEKGQKGEHMGPVAVGKSVLYIEKVQIQHIDTYRCVVQDCCSDKKEEMDIDIHVPDETCKEVYGVRNIVYGATWQFKNWTSAVQSCRDKGLEIAFPRNEAENVQLLKDIQASFTSHPNAIKYADENWVWIGAHDQVEEGVWIMAETGEKVEWFNWQENMPDNKNNGQDCIGIIRTNGEWDDSFIHKERPYVCMCRNNEEKEKKKDDEKKKTI